MISTSQDPDPRHWRGSSLLADPFALASLDGPGVLLDLITGAVYELNGAATLICAALARGEAIPAIADELAQSLRISRSRAAQVLQAVLAQLSDPAADVRVVTPAR